MLAEIFMVRLEAAVRPVQEKLPSSVSPFVPFSPSAQLTFKRNEDGLLKVRARSVRVKGSVVELAPGGGAVRRSYCRSKPLI